MKHSKFTKVLASVLCAMMLLSVIPFTAFAASTEEFKSETHTVFKNTESTLAPGVTQSIKYAYAKDGKQMVYYVATADVTRDDVVLQTSYYKQHDGGIMGMAKLTEQAAYANQKYTNPEDPNFISENYNVVAGTNASFYNMSTGQPLGITFIDGVSFGTNSYDNFFAILNDGKTAVIDYASNLGKYVDDNGKSTIWQAAAGSAWLVRDGKDVTANASGSYNTDRHSRTCVGVTAEGKVVLMVLDGRQEPFSCGGSFHELAQIMLEAGCVAAVNLDGGGSTTYASRPAGSDEFQVINRPSDGSERAISSGIIIASTAKPSNVFESAILTAESDYVTPGSTVKFTTTGVSPAGTSAQIPSEATVRLKDASMGTISDGAFVSNGTVGDAVIQMVYNGNVVGETTVHVVVPDIAFASTDMTVPYGKTFTLNVVGTTNGGLNSVTMKEGDVKFELSDAKMGTVSGSKYTTCDESAGVTGGTVTAKCVYDESRTATATVKFGKASVIAEDFENFDISTWEAGTNYGNKGPFGRLENAYVELVDSKTGKVRNGNYALALTADFTETTSSGYKSVKFTFPSIDLTGATKFGMWMYLPVEAANNLEFDIGEYEFYPENHDNIHGEGWYYISADASAVGDSVSKFAIYMTDPDEKYFNIFDKFTIFIDDLTIDYSDATDDREIPIFSSVKLVNSTDSEVALNGQIYNDNTVTVKATAVEDSKGNYTGLNYNSARVFVDGVALKATQFTCDNSGVITIANLVLSDGSHTFRFEIDDNAGNTGFATRKIVIKTEDSDVSVVRRSDAALPLADSIEYFDVVAKNVEDVQSVALTLSLDMLSAWELQGADVLYGFDISYKVDKFNNRAEITLTRTGNVEATGEQVIAALPVRVWATKSYLMDKYIEGNRVTSNSGLVDSGWALTPEAVWDSDGTHLVRMELKVNSIVVRYCDDTQDTFAGTEYNVITENNRYRTSYYYDKYGNLISADTTTVKQGKTSTHVHTATAFADKAATCTEAGYKNRTYCEACKSVVDWGTTIKATGHSYEAVDGVLKCHCGKTFSGVYTDGKTYENGVIANGWLENSYYVNGVKLTGIQKVDGYYYNFGTDGVSKGKYTGLFYDEIDKVYRYFQLGKLSSGWKQIDDEWYYFRESTQAAPRKGYVYWSGIPYQFEENGKLISGVWVTTDEGTRYYYASSSYYRTVNTATVAFYTIDGKVYGFDRNGYIYKDGVYGLGESNQKELVYYAFDKNGVRTDIIDFYNYSGIIKTTSGSMHYYVNGTAKQMGLIQIGDSFYYIRSGGVVATGSYYCTYNMTERIPIGTYTFDSNGRMQNVPTGEKNGITNENGTLYYYVNGVKQVNLGLIEIEDNGEKCYIYVRTAGQLAVGTYTVWINNDIVPYASEQNFDTDGKMKNAPVVETKNGIINENGTLYYYVNGVKQVNLGLIEIEDNGEKCYIYVRTAGQLAVGTYTVWINNDIVPYASEQNFDTDGKMKNAPVVETKNGIINENGTLYYYVNGVKQVNLGLIEIEDNGEKCYIYVRTAGQLAVGTYKVWINNGIVPYASAQAFGENGHMVVSK